MICVLWVEILERLRTSQRSFFPFILVSCFIYSLSLCTNKFNYLLSSTKNSLIIYSHWFLYYNLKRGWVDTLVKCSIHVPKDQVRLLPEVKNKKQPPYPWIRSTSLRPSRGNYWVCFNFFIVFLFLFYNLLLVQKVR